MRSPLLWLTSTTSSTIWERGSDVLLMRFSFMSALMTQSRVRRSIVLVKSIFLVMLPGGCVPGFPSMATSCGDCHITFYLAVPSAIVNTYISKSEALQIMHQSVGHIDIVRLQHLIPSGRWLWLIRLILRTSLETSRVICTVLRPWRLVHRSRPLSPSLTRSVLFSSLMSKVLMLWHPLRAASTRLVTLTLPSSICGCTCRHRRKSGIFWMSGSALIPGDASGAWDDQLSVSDWQRAAPEQEVSGYYWVNPILLRPCPSLKGLKV